LTVYDGIITLAWIGLLGVKPVAFTQMVVVLPLTVARTVILGLLALLLQATVDPSSNKTRAIAPLHWPAVDSL
jgi:hypothetical protein